MQHNQKPGPNPIDVKLYQRLLVALDSSNHANRGLLRAVTIAGYSADSSITGIHAFAAKLHDNRFRQMEGGLPEQYRKEEVLEEQRDTHDDLITRGLDLISDSYLDVGNRVCAETNTPYNRLSLEGKNYRVLADAVEIPGRHDDGRGEQHP